MAVDKPPGLATQAPPGSESLETLLREQLRSRTDYVAFPHRLDRGVSGVILVALRKKAARLLGEQFQSHKIEKLYLAVVAGRVDPDISRWSDFLRKIPDVARVEITDATDRLARTAETRVEVVRYNETLNRTLLRLYPETGRTHQLRAQAAKRGHPIVGDTLYGGPPLPDHDEFEERILLHAQSITFHDPRNGIRTTVTASDTLGESV